MVATSMEQLVSLCKRRGFIFQSGDIYGGLQGVYDYGPMGVELKNNLKNSWWKAMVYEREDIEGMDGSILSNRLVLKHSGHEETFTDPLSDCRSCKQRFRSDFIKDNTCPNCGSQELTEPRAFNLMFKTTTGPIADGQSFAYLRPETAQSIFTNFKNILDSSARRPPFGIAQMGKAFRNEITPKNFLFRVREFEQMELEFFVPPGTDETWHQYWIDKRQEWWSKQGLGTDRLQLLEQPKNELSHYSKRTVDILFRFPHGFEELEGIANRTDYDLGSHSKDQDKLDCVAKIHTNDVSNARLAYLDLQSNKWLVPFVIEPSAGVERGILAVLTAAYEEEQLEDGKIRCVLRLPRHLAPVKVAVMPLKRNNQEIREKAINMRRNLQKLGLGRIFLEDSGNIGKGYRRHDEIGTPICVTVDFQTLEDGSVTLRNRDTMKQTRLNADQLTSYVKDFYSEEGVAL